MKEKKFDNIPDILDPNLSDTLAKIADNMFGRESWHIQLYIADDGTGSVEMTSNSQTHGMNFSDKEICETYFSIPKGRREHSEEEELLDDIYKWEKSVRWDWQDQYPKYHVAFQTKSDDGSYIIRRQVLNQFDMSDWKNSMIYDTFKRTNTTSERKNKNGEDQVDYGWHYGRHKDSETEMTRIDEQDEEAEALETDEISVQFKKIYDMWVQKLRPRLNESTQKDVPRPYDTKSRTHSNIIDMMNNFDQILLKLKESRAADAGNIDNYASDFAELRESFMFIEQNIIPQSTYRGDEFEEDWNDFTKEMNLFIRLIEDNSKLI